jgi:hypothetical protein
VSDFVRSRARETYRVISPVSKPAAGDWSSGGRHRTDVSTKARLRSQLSSSSIAPRLGDHSDHTGGLVPLLRETNSSIRRRATLGESYTPPPARTRTARISSAGSVSLVRKPLAPARVARVFVANRLAPMPVIRGSRRPSRPRATGR